MDDYDHDYHATDQVTMGMATNKVGSKQEQTTTLEGWTGLREEDLQNMTAHEIQGELDDALNDFILSHLDSWCRREPA